MHLVSYVLSPRYLAMGTTRVPHLTLGLGMMLLLNRALYWWWLAMENQLRRRHAFPVVPQ